MLQTTQTMFGSTLVLLYIGFDSHAAQTILLRVGRVTGGRTFGKDPKLPKNSLS